MAKPLTSQQLREAARLMRGFGGARTFMCHAYEDVGGDRKELRTLLEAAIGPVSESWHALPMPEGTSCYDRPSLAWRFDLFNILAEYLDAEQSELATASPGAKPRGRKIKAH